MIAPHESIASVEVVGPDSANRNRLSKIEEIEGQLLQLPQVDVPLNHMFAPGVYAREVVMPTDSFVIGHEHKTEHFNIILTGRATVMMEGVIHDIKAPAIIKSNRNVRKILYIHEEMHWVTIHPTDETNIEKLEEMLVVKSDTYLNHQTQKEIEALQAHLLTQEN
jgi:hypothetical protein